jgi:tRNA nucleotidyltransferase (CCA-adding enzyme)
VIHLPEILEPLFKRLNDSGIIPILVGGFVRDALLNIPSNDIDIELYGVTSLNDLETLLTEFGKVNLVGKSFGVLKLKLGNFSLDFSPPRTESKQGFGHKGFEIHSYQNLDYESASRRRDFTINSIGYNPLTHEMLDPHGGVDDLHHKRLRYIDRESFADDPLRILRAVQFAARFVLSCDNALLELCREMIAKGALEELPKERIFEEIKKLLLLSKKPSIGLSLLDQIGGSYLFAPSSPKAWEHALIRCDSIVKNGNEKHDLPLLFASLLLEIPKPLDVIEKIVFQHSLIASTLSIIEYEQNYAIFDFPPPPLLQGRDLIAQGLSPSIVFKSILDAAYHAQKQGKFQTHDEAIEWLKRHHSCALVTML